MVDHSLTLTFFQLALTHGHPKAHFRQATIYDFDSPLADPILLDLAIAGDDVVCSGAMSAMSAKLSRFLSATKLLLH
jgi:hypothetical protein